jgi:HSP20 family protein
MYNKNLILNNDNLLAVANNLLDRSFKNTNSGYTPPMDIVEHESFYDIRIALPGFSKEEISINLEDKTLKIEANKNKEDNLDNIKVFKNQIFKGEFKQNFKLTDTIDVNNINAEYVNGIISIQLHKVVSEKKNITIEIK